VASTIVLQYGHSDGLDIIYKRRKELACVICEPMPAILCDYDVKFLSQLGEVCRDAGIPMIFDEVVSGFRVAYGGVQTLLGQAPDITCLGRVIGGGLPCGAARQPSVNSGSPRKFVYTAFKKAPTVLPSRKRIYRRLIRGGGP
jgi:glutamate-1-semialdehyde 2,1-aminomutase